MPFPRCSPEGSSRLSVQSRDGRNHDGVNVGSDGAYGYVVVDYAQTAMAALAIMMMALVVLIMMVPSARSARGRSHLKSDRPDATKASPHTQSRLL